jgi:hypothetical protein
MKLFQVLHQLHSREQTQFRHFVDSPLFNKREDLKLLLGHWLDRKGRAAPAEDHWQALFPNQPFSSTQWNLLASRLFKLLEEFLALQQIRKDDAQTKFHLAKAYRNLQQEKYFAEAIRDAGLALEKQDFRDTAYLQNRHDFSFERYDYILSSNRKAKTNLQEVSNELDAYFLAAKLRQACNALSRQTINPEQYAIGLLPEVLAYVEKHPAYLQVPAIAIYYYCYRAINAKEEETYFSRFREAIESYQQYFPPYEMRDLYTFVINVYIRKLNTGAKIYAEEAFALYRLSLAQGYLLDDGVLLESTYVNIVVLAAILGDYQWAIDFVKEYQPLLKSEFRVPLYHFCLGRIYYEQGEQEESLRQLVLVDTKASFIYLGARVLQLKIYYELGEYNPLESLLESLRVYLQRSKDLGYRKAHYHHLLAFTRQLLQLPAMDKAARTAFRQRIEAAEVFGEKEWFLRQVG